MAGIILDIDIDDAVAIAFFEYAGYHIRDAREPLRRSMLEVVFPAIREQLDTEGERSGDRWEELSSDYSTWKEANYPGEPILRLTGDMERALFDPLSYRVTRDALTYRPRDKKAEWHQTGRSAPNFMPARPIVELTTEDDEMIQDIFQDWLDELRLANSRRGNNTFPVSGPSVNVLGF